MCDLFLSVHFSVVAIFFDLFIALLVYKGACRHGRVVGGRRAVLGQSSWPFPEYQSTQSVRQAGRQADGMLGS